MPFGGLAVVRAASASRPAPDEIVGLIGANGAGKSTLLNAISGFVPGAGGIVVLRASTSRAGAAHQRARARLGRVFQDARLFGDLTVRETVQVALEARRAQRVRPVRCSACPGAARAERAQAPRPPRSSTSSASAATPTRFVGELSTGTRRIVELSCLRRPRRPAAAPRRAHRRRRPARDRGLRPAAPAIQDELDATDRRHRARHAARDGDQRSRLLPRGRRASSPRARPPRSATTRWSIAAYLGTDERAIARSGPLPATSRARSPPDRGLPVQPRWAGTSVSNGSRPTGEPHAADPHRRAERRRARAISDPPRRRAGRPSRRRRSPRPPLAATRSAQPSTWDGR